MKYSQYSFSKIATFNQCNRKFKYKYIDKIKIEFLPNIALEKGDLIHSIIEKILLNQSIPTKDVILSRYKVLKENDFNNCIKIIKNMANFNIWKSIKSLPYKRNVELNFFLDKNLIPVEERKSSILTGKIDFLIINEKKKIGLIVDWKTGGKNKENIEKYPKDEEQLEIYALWALQKFQLKGIKSKFFYVEHDIEQSKIITQQEIEKYKEKIQTVINRIENCIDFEPTVGPLCDYCDYKEQCRIINN